MREPFEPRFVRKCEEKLSQLFAFLESRPARNCVFMVAPVIAAMLGPWSKVMPLLLVCIVVGVVMWTRRNGRTRQMGRSLVIGSSLGFVYLFIAVGLGWG